MSNFPSDRSIIYCATFLRSLGLGMIGVLLGIYLIQLDLTKTQIGVVISSGLFGGAFGNLFVTIFGDRFGRKKTLIVYAILSAVGGLAVSLCTSFYTIVIAAFFGMLNAKGKDRGGAVVLETAIMPSLLKDSKDRTKSFAWYTFIQEIGLALGGVLAGLPTLISSIWGLDKLIAFKSTFIVFSGLMLIVAFLYLYLSAKVEVPIKHMEFKASPEGKKVITKLGAIFAIDSLAGGFLTSALIAYYFYERFDISVEALGIFFFFARCLNGVSNLAAVWISKKIGLLNAIVCTHAPSSLILIAVVFAPTFPIAAFLFLVRELIVEVDNPTKQSYQMAIVKPEERTTMAGVSLIVRMMGWAIAPAFAGMIMQKYSNGIPIFIGAGLKLFYDLVLFIAFRKIKPPEEIAAAQAKEQKVPPIELQPATV